MVDCTMRIFRKLKKLGDFHISQHNNALSPLSHRHQIADESAAVNMNYGPLPRSFFSAVNLAREEGGYDPLPVFVREPVPHRDRYAMNRRPRGQFPEFNRSRSESRERLFDRSNQPFLNVYLVLLLNFAEDLFLLTYYSHVMRHPFSWVHINFLLLLI